VHPLATEAMTELGIDISAQRSKSVDKFRDTQFDFVVILCDNVAQCLAQGDNSVAKENS
jgi:protein-tyrosine-phosphatase